MGEFLLLVVQETWIILKEASVFLLLGFVVAGLIAILMPAKTLSRFFGSGKTRSVLWASTLGIPLPLCSCGVLPAALGLRRQGATKGATVAFLISTPETGVDSISVSYALMDPIITVFRPAAAMITAVAAGLATNLFGEPKAQPAEALAPASAGEVASIADASAELDAHDHGHECQGLIAAGEAADARRGPVRILRHVLTYAFRELLDETSYWLMLGFVLSGLVAALLPPTVFERYLSGEFTSMLAMLLIGVPIYTCASASTPIAAALVLKGLNPGAALVFLLAGPATNLGSLTVLIKFLGMRIVAIYLAAIVVVTLLAGYALNLVYRSWELDPLATFGTATTFIPEPVKIAGAVVLLVLLALSMRRAHLPSEWLTMADKFSALTGIRPTGRGLRNAALAAVALLYVSTGLFSVRPGERAILSRFGEIVDDELGPGLHYRLPWPFESHRIVGEDLVRRVEPGFGSEASDVATGFWCQQEKVAAGSFLVTGDTDNLSIGLVLQYIVSNPADFRFQTEAPDVLVASLAESVLTETVPAIPLEVVLTVGRLAIQEQVKLETQAMLDRYRCGIQITSTTIMTITRHASAAEAFRKVADALANREKKRSEARGYANNFLNKARGEAGSNLMEARSYHERQLAEAIGTTGAVVALLAEYEKAPAITRMRLYLEAMAKTPPKVEKFIIDPEQGRIPFNFRIIKT